MKRNAGQGEMLAIKVLQGKSTGAPLVFYRDINDHLFLQQLCTQGEEFAHTLSPFDLIVPSRIHNR